MKKYYFVYGYTERYVWMPNSPVAYSKNDFQDIINTHPIAYQIDCNDKYNKEKPYHSGKIRESYVVTNWQELPEAEYVKFNGWI